VEEVPMKIRFLALASLLAASPGRAELLSWEMLPADESRIKNSGVGDGSTDSAATGEATLTYDTTAGRVSWDVSWSDLGATGPGLSAIHVHGPATASQSSPTHVFDIFSTEEDVIDSGVDRISGSTTNPGEALDAVLDRTGNPRMDAGVAVSFMYQDLAYVNIHSVTWPMGEIRANFERSGGQLPQTADQDKCSQANDKSLQRLAQKRASQFKKCVKNGTKGKGSAEACVTGQKPNPVDKAEVKTRDDFGKRCHGFDRDGNPRLALFGSELPEPVNLAALDEETRLLRALFGPDLDAAIQIGDIGKCQSAVVAEAQKCDKAKLAEFVKCKKAGFKAGTLHDTAGIESCLGSDPKGKVAKVCGEKLEGKLTKKCQGIDLGAAFPAFGAADAAGAAAGIDDVLDCQVCQMTRRAGRLGIDCDLFDDEIDNDSCEPLS
jgi:hypothetical protein